jgi:hypothetical protein
MNNKVLLHVSLMSVFHLKEWLTMVNGELCDRRARPKNTPVAPDVMAENLGEYPSVLEVPNKSLMTCPDTALHL